MKIQSIALTIFKVFKQLKLDFNNDSVIIFGVNGTGKSTVLSAINYLFRIFLYQIDPIQTKAFSSISREEITVGEDHLIIDAKVLMGGSIHKLLRSYEIPIKNVRKKNNGYPSVNYTVFRETFRDHYLNDDTGMPIYIYYGTNRSVITIPNSGKKESNFDKLSALDRAISKTVDFKSFFEWYREVEADEILQIRDNGYLDYEDPALKWVRTAIERMIGDVSGLRIERNPTRMVVNKAEKEIRVDLLSDGEKCVLAMLGDLARRLVLANPKAQNPLEGSGIVLVDEIELHMHPSWQRKILKILRELFPNIQFIISTHSPQVLGEADDGYRIYSLDTDENGYGIARRIARMNGFDSNMILEEYMGTESISKEKKMLVSDINRCINQGDYKEAETMMEQLELLSGVDDAEYILAQNYLLRRQRER